MCDVFDVFGFVLIFFSEFCKQDLQVPRILFLKNRFDSIAKQEKEIKVTGAVLVPAGPVDYFEQKKPPNCCRILWQRFAE